MSQRLRAAIGHDQLTAIMTNNPTAKKSSVIWFVLKDVLVTMWHVVSVAATGIMQAAIGMNPENKFWIAVSELPYGRAPTGKILSEKRKKFSCLLSLD